jgi:hypothetical protein
MTENRFFTFIWRFNGIAIMLTTLVVIIVGGVLGVVMYRDFTRQRAVTNIVNVEGAGNVSEKLRLGQSSPIEGTSYLMVPLTSDQAYSQSYYDKSSYSQRNVLFVDTKGTGSHWLFDTNEYLIINDNYIAERGEQQKPKPVKAILYLVVKADTNHDKRLTDNDTKTIGLSSPDGSNYKEVIAEVDLLVGHHLIDNDSLIVVYQKQGMGYSARVALSDFSVLSRTELPKIKKAALTSR